MDQGLTHVALPATDPDRSAEFYAGYSGLEVVHRRQDPDTESVVVWLSDHTRPFAVVLIEAPVTHVLAGIAHLGVGVASRDAVDAAAARARAEGCLAVAPADHGPPVGYVCMVRDPDGHILELSHGQDVGLVAG